MTGASGAQEIGPARTKQGRRARGAGQSRRWSAIEAATNVGVGYALAIIVQALVFPIFGFIASTGQHMAIALVFTGVSLVRGYIIRRLFERWGHRLWRNR